MTCLIVKTKKGGQFVRHGRTGGEPEKQCSSRGCYERGTYLCDATLRMDEGSGTQIPVLCDAPICALHRVEERPGRDLCPAHVPAAP